MQNKKFEEKTDAELIKLEKSSRIVTYMLAGMILVLIVLNIFLAFKKGFSAISVVPIALLPIVFINFSSIKKMREELKARGL